MTATVIQPFVTDVYRDLRDGVPIEDAIASRFPPEAKANMVAAMRTDFINGRERSYSDVEMRTYFVAMGLPAEWITEAMA